MVEPVLCVDPRPRLTTQDALPGRGLPALRREYMRLSRAIDSKNEMNSIPKLKI